MQARARSVLEQAGDDDEPARESARPRRARWLMLAALIPPAVLISLLIAQQREPRAHAAGGHLVSAAPAQPAAADVAVEHARADEPAQDYVDEYVAEPKEQENPAVATPAVPRRRASVAAPQLQAAGRALRTAVDRLSDFGGRR
jgi:hypothetical protein